MKKLLLAVGILVVLLALGGYLLFSNLDYLIKTTVEKYGSAATQSDVRLAGVDLQLRSGDGKLSGLSVGNPKGFSSAHAFDLGTIEVKLDTGTIRGTGPIVIEQVVIDQPQVSYELLNSGTSNLQVLKENAAAYANSLQGKQRAAKPDAVSTATADPQQGQPGRKLIIRDLRIRRGHVAISQQLLNRQLGTDLPEIHLTNIGQASGGATAAQVTDQLLSALTNAAAQASISTLAKEKISGALKAVPIQSITGAAGDTVNNHLKGLLGN